MQNFFQSKTTRRTLGIIGTVFVALVIFQAGVFVGYRRAAFSYHWGDKYERTFGGRDRGGMMGGGMGRMGFPREDFTNANGAVGKIITIHLPTIVLADRDGIEKIILIKSDTIIRHFRDMLTPADLKLGDEIIVVGAPNDSGQVEAKLIRIMPQGMMNGMMGTSTKAQ